MTVNGVPETATSLPYSVWVDSGSSVTYSFASPVTSSSVSTTQYRWGTSSGLDAAQSDILTVTGTGTVIGNYVTQYDLQFAQSGLDSSAQGTVVSVTVGVSPPVNLFKASSPMTLATWTKVRLYRTLSPLQSPALTAASSLFLRRQQLHLHQASLLLEQLLSLAHTRLSTRCLSLRLDNQ